tara:strand:- start:2148 stop:3212 length:1065 start_codon:yes stop_codon:yes gene_type:complete
MNDFYSVMRPMLFMLGAEQAHNLAIWLLKTGLAWSDENPDPSLLQVRLWGRKFPNPIGLAAGFDKNAEVFDAILRLGFGFVEVGTVTPEAQSGNLKPRLFRLINDEGVINRMGFNNNGHAQAMMVLRARNRTIPGKIGVNLGKNKESESSVNDYVKGVNAFGTMADYLVINVSSPNTPGLLALQNKEELRVLLGSVKGALKALDIVDKPPILLKVGPDLTKKDKEDIAEVVIETRIDGIIATNTSTERPNFLSSKYRSETGGLSGQPLFDMSTQVLSDFYKLTRGQLPLVGVGGVGSGEQAYAKIRAGASLVELYSALIYKGPRFVGQVKRELTILLERDGFASVMDAVGVDCQ